LSPWLLLGQVEGGGRKDLGLEEVVGVKVEPVDLVTPGIVSAGGREGSSPVAKIKLYHNKEQTLGWVNRRLEHNKGRWMCRARKQGRSRWLLMWIKLREILVVRTRMLTLIPLLGLINREMAVQVCDRKVDHQPAEFRGRIWEGKILHQAGQVISSVHVVGLRVI
jgi:hypothetical protein